MRTKKTSPKRYNKPQAVAVGFFYGQKSPRHDTLRLEINLKGVSQHDRARVVNRIMRLADDYGFGK